MPGQTARSSPLARLAAAIGVAAAALQEDQAELADLDLVSPAERDFLDPVPVHVGAVEAADIAHGKPGAVAVELGMPPGYGHVVEEDVAVRPAAHHRQVAVKQEPASRVRPALDHEQRG